MKTLLLSITLLLASTLYGQTIKQDKDGNYYQVSAKSTNTPDKKTGKTFKAADGLTYDIYISKNGKYYVIRTSKKTGNIYKQYIKI